jgi:hypothetical protein
MNHKEKNYYITEDQLLILYKTVCLMDPVINDWRRRDELKKNFDSLVVKIKSQEVKEKTESQNDIEDNFLHNFKDNCKLTDNPKGLAVYECGDHGMVFHVDESLCREAHDSDIIQDFIKKYPVDIYPSLFIEGLLSVLKKREINDEQTT